MSQDLILTFLRNRRESGDESFFTAVEIYKHLISQGYEVPKNSIWPKCCQLVRYRCIEGKNPDPLSPTDRHDWTLKFRGKLC